MQVRVTIDVSDIDRLIIGAAKDGVFRAAKRDEIQEFVENAYESVIAQPRATYLDLTQSTVSAIQESLGV